MRYRSMRRPASIRANFRADIKIISGTIVDFSYSGLSVDFDERVKKGQKVALILKNSEPLGEIVQLDDDGLAGVRFIHQIPKSQHQELVTAARDGNRATLRGLSEL